MDFVDYNGFEIPVMTRTDPNPFYNLDDRDKYRFSTGLREGQPGSCFRRPYGTAFEDAGIERIEQRRWKEEAQRQERNRGGLIDLLLENDVPTKNQNGLGYCWCYGVTTAYEANRLLQGLPYVELSADSVAAEVKNGRNEGGWGEDALEHAERHGFVPQGLWKPHDTNWRRYQNDPEVKTERAKYKPAEWLNLPQGDMEAEASLLLRNVSCGMGLMWWGHLVAFLQIVWSDRHGPLWVYRNSHSDSFGNKGFCAATTQVARHGGGSAVRLAA